MANMSYCRFENTLPDIRDCYDHMDDCDHEDLSDTEARARIHIIKICKKIVDDYGYEIAP